MTDIYNQSETQLPAERQNYNYLRFTENYLEITPDGDANIFVTIHAKHGTSKVNVIVYLQRYDGDWTTVERWTKEKRGNYLSLYERTKTEKGITYRIQVYSYADKDAYSECYLCENNHLF